MPRKAKPKHPPKRVEVLLQKMHHQALCKTMTQPSALVADHGKAIYHLEPSQKAVAPKTAELAMELGLIVPQGDGLLGDSQTWRLV
jgi:hypothetical protein